MTVSSYSTRSEGPRQSASLGSRLRNSWNNTPTRWYPIPIALGAAVLLATQYRKSPFSTKASPDEVQVSGDGGDVALKGSGPWQVRVLGALPLRSLSQLWGYLNGLELPVWFRPFGFKLYSSIFGCNLTEIDPPDLKQYPSLGEFFYRKLQPGARPIDASEGTVLVSPADGKVLHFGEIEGGRVEQVKGMTYELGALLGTGGKSQRDVEEIQFKNESKKVDDEHFAQINDIEYSLSTLLGTSKTQTEVHEHPDPSAPTSSPPSSSTKPHTHDATPSDQTTLNPQKISHDTQVAMELGPSAAFNAQTVPSSGISQLGDQATARAGKPILKEGNKLFFMVVYLAPGDYHRFHSPTAWVVERRRHFTGELFSVSPYIARRVRDLFVLNERVALLGRWKHGFFGMVPVGATNVGSICINFDENLRTNERHPKHPPQTFTEAVYTKASAFLQGQPLTAGEEMGGFKLGSTIVLVFEAPEGFRFTVEEGKKVKVGERMGVIGEIKGEKEGRVRIERIE